MTWPSGMKKVIDIIHIQNSKNVLLVNGLYIRSPSFSFPFQNDKYRPLTPAGGQSDFFSCRCRTYMLVGKFGTFLFQTTWADNKVAFVATSSLMSDWCVTAFSDSREDRKLWEEVKETEFWYDAARLKPAMSIWATQDLISVTVYDWYSFFSFLLLNRRGRTRSDVKMYGIRIWCEPDSNLQILYNSHIPPSPPSDEEETPADYHTLVKSELDAQDDFVSEQQERSVWVSCCCCFFYFWPAT